MAQARGRIEPHPQVIPCEPEEELKKCLGYAQKLNSAEHHVGCGGEAFPETQCG
jgi:hypothetical protein